MQMLVLVILTVFLGIFSLVKAKANKFKELGHKLGHKRPRFFSKAAQSKTIIEQPVLDFNTPDTAGQVKSKKELAREREKDLHSGMELLELSFLLRIVENTNGVDEKDVIIRKLNFKELLRRGKLNEANSNALKIYAINKGNLYGKDIQCEAMKNLAERTANGGKRSN